MIKPGPGKLPELKSEEEELRFWDANDPSDFIEGPGDLIIRLKRRLRKQVTIRLDEPLYDELRAAADENGVPYQQLMRELLRQSLRALRAERRRAAAGRAPSRPKAAAARRSGATRGGG